MSDNAINPRPPAATMAAAMQFHKMIVHLLPPKHSWGERREGGGGGGGRRGGRRGEETRGGGGRGEERRGEGGTKLPIVVVAALPEPLRVVLSFRKMAFLISFFGPPALRWGAN